MIRICTAVLVMCCATLQVSAEGYSGKANCDKLVALFIDLAKRSGETASEETARAEVLSENPSDSDCAAMLALFPAQE